MPDQEPDIAHALKQLRESMRTLKLHVLTYRTRVMGLALRKPSGITDLPDIHEKKKEQGN
jgi:hypothetical protein